MRQIEPTADRVRALFVYDHETGVFRYNTARARMKAGEVAGSTPSRIGVYVTLWIDRRRYYAHRVAWLYVHGEWPSELIDHVDGNPQNNAIANLRLATSSQNHWNTGLYKNNTSGFKGVFWIKAADKWMARLSCEGRKINLGRFGSAEEASLAYQAAAQKYAAQFANDGSQPANLVGRVR